MPVPDVSFVETIADEGETGYEMVEQLCQPTPAASSEPRKTPGSLSSSKSLPSENDFVPGSGGQKWKASLSSQGSRQRSRGEILLEMGRRKWPILPQTF